MVGGTDSPERANLLFNRLAEAMIQSLKEMADRGEKLSTEAITASLTQKTELTELLLSPEPKSGESGDSGQLERLSKQKRELLRRLEEAEERASQRDDFSRRAILTLLRLSGADQGDELSTALGEFKTGLLEGIQAEDLENRLREVKNRILQEGTEGKKGTGGHGLGRLFKPGSKPTEVRADSALEKVKQTYLDLLKEFDLDLGPEYMLLMGRVTLEIRNSDDLDHLFSLRPRITQIIHTYAHLVHEERQEAAVFIAEMAQRLSEIENHLMLSLDHTRNWTRNENAFRSDFLSQIEKFTTKARRSTQLEELRQMVATRLSSLKTVMEEKQKRDTSLIGSLENELDCLRLKIEETNQAVDKTNQENQALRAKLHQDPLTGALNRGGLEKHMASEMNRFQRYGRAWSLIMIDIDHFKRVNDTFGHPAGDAVLKELVSRFSPLLRSTDIMGRYGGEEFAVIMPETIGPNALEVARKLRQAIEVTEFLHRGRDVPVTISLGVAQVQEMDPDAQSVLARADKALYKAKKEGRNRVEML